MIHRIERPPHAGEAVAAAALLGGGGKSPCHQRARPHATMSGWYCRHQIHDSKSPSSLSMRAATTPAFALALMSSTLPAQAGAAKPAAFVDAAAVVAGLIVDM